MQPRALAHTMHGGHPLDVHLRDVARVAQGFAEQFGAGELAYWAGLWHDIGKYHPAFQQYLLDAEAGIKRKGPDHKTAGAALAQRWGRELAYLIIGHHGGLHDANGTETSAEVWLKERRNLPAVAEAQALARAEIPDLEPTAPLAPPSWVRDELGGEFLTRMLFSALVDADRLDTERHFTPERGARRAGYPTLAELWPSLEYYQSANRGDPRNPVNRVRDEVYAACLAAARLEPGFFRLTAPTGGGKTRSGLAFAMRHALTHGKQRIIVAIPYLTITDQTASVYRGIFAAHPRAVLEHHSAAWRNERDDADVTRWEELAAENWDAPLVVTTMVQFFESLLAASASDCRKLHNIANSIVILDEVQTLPEKYLTPIHSVLRELVANYGVSVVLSTATQPALEPRAGFGGLPNVREIVPGHGEHFRLLQRVRYDIVPEPWSWERVATEMLESPQSLAVVNTRRDARILLDALEGQAAGGVLHLSTNLCGAHRAAVLADVRARLRAGRLCRLVSTQVVEAGVDLDFPLVFRAIGPLDRIVQAGGRCNREGLLDVGRVVVFVPEDGALPRGAYETATALALDLLSEHHIDLHAPATYLRYFDDLYSRVERDSKQIERQRRAYAFRSVASDFRLVDAPTEPVVVPYSSPARDGEQRISAPPDVLLQRLIDRHGNPRDLWRALQPYIVNMRTRDVRRCLHAGLLVEALPGLYEWKGEYDQTRGLVEQGPAPEDWVV
ncbi:MAG: CRISPR-associated endonuclease Cas3'' [Chloroflexi bacterium]|nr:MAG: CRISPR-associated endonuclease Cas3'' [Chloroflexota bacterium]